MPPAPAATPTSILPRRSCLVTDRRRPSEPPAGPKGRAAGGTDRKALGKGLGALIGDGKAALARAGGAGGDGCRRAVRRATVAGGRREGRRGLYPDGLDDTQRLD